MPFLFLIFIDALLSALGRHKTQQTAKPYSEQPFQYPVMPREDHTLITSFDEIAYEILLSTYGEFSLCTKNIDRHRQENIFQQWQQKYMVHFHQKLDEAATAFVSENRSLVTIDWLRKKIGMLIQHYLQIFTLRAQTL